MSKLYLLSQIRIIEQDRKEQDKSQKEATDRKKELERWAAEREKEK